VERGGRTSSYAKKTSSCGGERNNWRHTALGSLSFWKVSTGMNAFTPPMFYAVAAVIASARTHDSQGRRHRSFP
jgi:hypothetical protein